MDTEPTGGAPWTDGEIATIREFVAHPMVDPLWKFGGDPTLVTRRWLATLERAAPQMEALREEVRVQAAKHADCCVDRQERDGLVKILRALMSLIDDGLLVRSTTNDAHFPSYLAESTRLVATLADAQTVLDAMEVSL